MRNILCLLSIVLFCSCAQKVYFFEASKLSTPNDNDKIFMDAQFAGDALDYVIFELDIENNSRDTIHLTYRDVYLEVYEKGESHRPVILDALAKEDIIWTLEQREEQLRHEKTSRDINNAINIGLSFLYFGSAGGYGSIDAILFSVDVAAYMLEDARSYKLMKGTLEEQMAYVNEWVLFEAILAPKEKTSYDVLFPRQLFEASASFVVEIDNFTYTQEFELYIKEEKVR